MGKLGRWGGIAAVIGVVGVMMSTRKQLGLSLGWDREAALQWLRNMSDLLGFWAIPAYVGIHTLTLALCLPYAVFFEAGASLLFGFIPAVFCVFSAKVLGASLSFWVGRCVCLSTNLCLFTYLSENFNFGYYAALCSYYCVGSSFLNDELKEVNASLDMFLFL